MHEDDRLSERLRLVPVPEHGPDYRMRREQALAGARPITPGQGRTQAPLGQRRRPIMRRVLIAAAAAIGLTAVVVGAVVSTTGNGDGTNVAPAPSPSQAQHHARGIVAGKAPVLVGDELTGMVRGLDGGLWAWGYRHRQGGPGTPLLERWDGQSWQDVAMPASSTARADEIAGVAAVSADDVWVAENTRRGGLLSHWDGAGWTDFPAFGFAGTSETSNALLALSTDDVWAVSAAMTPATGAIKHSRLTTLHWDGTRWTSVPAPSLGRGVGEVWLRLIRGASPDAVWALGDSQRYRRKTVGGKRKWAVTRSAQFLLFWDGRRWTRQPWPTLQPSHGTKDEIAIDDLAVTSDGELWCAGRRWFGPDNRGDLFVPVVLRLRAGRREIMASGSTPSLPADWRRFMPSSIALTSSQDAWVAGGNDTSSSLWHWDGSAWSVVTLPETQSPAEFRARSVLAVGADDIWVSAKGAPRVIAWSSSSPSSCTLTGPRGNVSQRRRTLVRRDRQTDEDGTPNDGRRRRSGPAAHAQGAR